MILAALVGKNIEVCRQNLSPRHLTEGNATGILMQFAGSCRLLGGSLFHIKMYLTLE